MEESLRPTIIDLFAGAGGLSEGFWSQNFEVVSHVEMDKDACETLRTRALYYQLKKRNELADYYSYIKGHISRDKLVSKHRLGSTVDSILHNQIDNTSYDRILTTLKSQLASRPLDGIIGGPPCQAYSNIGRARDKNGMVGDVRNYLYKFYLSFLKDLSPNFFIFENVPGIYTAGDGTYLKDMLAGMKKLGYIVPPPRTVNTAHYNVPQSRKRVIVIGWKSSITLNIDKIFEVPDVIDFSVNDFLSDLQPLKSGGGKSLSKYTQINELLNQLHIRNEKDLALDHICRPHNEQDKEIYRIAVKRLIAGERLSYTDLPSRLKSHKNQKSFLDRFKVVDSSMRASHTIVAHIAKDGHHFIHPDIAQNRSLSVREAARIQTFPDDFKFEGSRTAMYKQIGNAVPPIFATHLAGKISLQISALKMKSVA